jgi:O-antigen/teichoic acid export membrane protein
VLQLLSLAGVAQSFQSFNGNVYQARGRPGLFLSFMVCSSAVTFSAFVIGLHWGVAGVAGSFAVARAIVLLANTWQLCRLIELSLVRTLRSYLEIIWMAALMAALIYAVRLELINWGAAAWLRLLLLTLLGAGVYFALVAKWSFDLIAEIRGVVRSRSPQTT